VKFRCVDAEKAYPVEMMCRLLGVSRAGYYAWRHRRPSRRVERDQALSARIRSVFTESRRTYGSPRVTAELRASGEQVARKRVARLMRMEGLVARRRRRYVRTTDSRHDAPVPSNALDRRFSTETNAWVADITYLSTFEGWVYLAVVLDLRTRAVVGWSMTQALDEGLALKALRMALDRHKAPQLHHSDRGAQYASLEYETLLAAHGFRRSMSRPGNCWDNAVAESFFSTLKTECTRGRRFVTRQAAKSTVFGYIEGFYNSRRRHSSLGYRSPAEYEREVTRAA
jgi:putative transposase